MTALPEASLNGSIAPLHGGAIVLEQNDSDRRRWAKLTDQQRVRVSTKLAIFQAIAGEVQRTGNKRAVMDLCRAHAARLQQRGFSAVRMYNEYYAWQRAGRHWSALVSTGSIDRGLPQETVNFIHGWMQRNQRSGKQGWRDFLVHHWRKGGAVPGIGTWQEWFVGKWPMRSLPPQCPPDLPTGWSYENLVRKLDKVETALARRGIAAALAELPPIPGTRADMRPLEWITFDDVKLDFRVHVESVGRPVDVVALVAFDIATATVLGFGIRPVLLREDGTGEKLKARDSKALFVDLLLRWGWADYGMHVIQENGTAHLDTAFQAALREATGGLVQVHDASMIGGTVWAGGFTDRAVGNSRAKSWLESTFNPLHNRLAMIEGQTGRRYDVAPQDDHGRRRELKALVEAGERIDPTLRAQFRMPYRSLADVRPLLAEAIRALNARTDHALKDFEDMLVWRFREGDPWQSEAEMLDYDPAALEQILTDRVPESPAWRFARLVKAEHAAGTQFFHLHETSVPRLLEDQKWIAKDGGEVVFRMEQKSCLYSPYTALNVPTLEAMEPGRDYLAYFDACSGQIPPVTLYVTTGDGRWVGTLHHTAGISRRDKDGGKAAIAKKKSMLNAAIDRVNRNSPQVAEENEERLARNLDVLARAEAMQVPEDLTAVATRDTSAPEAHARATEEVITAAQREAAARRVNPTKAAAELTRLQRQAATLSQKENPALAEDEGWA